MEEPEDGATSAGLKNLAELAENSMEMVGGGSGRMVFQNQEQSEQLPVNGNAMEMENDAGREADEDTQEVEMAVDEQDEGGESGEGGQIVIPGLGGDLSGIHLPPSDDFAVSSTTEVDVSITQPPPQVDSGTSDQVQVKQTPPSPPKETPQSAWVETEVVQQQEPPAPAPPAPAPPPTQNQSVEDVASEYNYKFQYSADGYHYYTDQENLWYAQDEGGYWYYQNSSDGSFVPWDNNSSGGGGTDNTNKVAGSTTKGGSSIITS